MDGKPNVSFPVHVGSNITHRDVYEVTLPVAVTPFQRNHGPKETSKAGGVGGLLTPETQWATFRFTDHGRESAHGLRQQAVAFVFSPRVVEAEWRDGNDDEAWPSSQGVA